MTTSHLPGGEPEHARNDQIPDRKEKRLVQPREMGLIDGIDLSNVSRAQLLRAVAQTEIVCVQNLFNLADQRSMDVLIECQARERVLLIPGTRTRAHLAENLASAGVELDDVTRTELARHFPAI